MPLTLAKKERYKRTHGKKGFDSLSNSCFINARRTGKQGPILTLNNLGLIKYGKTLQQKQAYKNRYLA